MISMLASRKIFLGASAMITAKVVEVLGIFGARRVASLLQPSLLRDGSDGLAIHTMSTGELAARAEQAAGLQRMIAAADAVSLVLGTLGLLLVLTGLYQLAVLVESGRTRPDPGADHPASKP